MCLGRLGDPRIPSLRDPSAYVEVPAGTYPYGDEKETLIKIAASFRLSRYPVTNRQFQDFLEEKGYEKQQWWSDAGWAWLQSEGVTEPALWRDRRWNSPNQPVVGVSFWEAEACSKWAGGRLPREEEWEAAPRGSGGSVYPWGNDWVDGICNTLEAGLGVTSPVGLFPGSRQAECGIEDLAGNVWEWCECTIGLTLGCRSVLRRCLDSVDRNTLFGAELLGLIEHTLNLCEIGDCEFGHVGLRRL